MLLAQDSKYSVKERSIFLQSQLLGVSIILPKGMHALLLSLLVASVYGRVYEGSLTGKSSFAYIGKFVFEFDGKLSLRYLISW